MDEMNNDVLPYEPKPYEDPTKSNVLTEEQKAYMVCPSKAGYFSLQICQACEI